MTSPGEKQKNYLELFRYRPDTFGTIRATGIDKYPGEMPIVRELLQNADDSGATYFIIYHTPTEIIIEHNGIPFSKPDEVENIEDSDYYRISHIGLGKNTEETTGKFGIGFTTVFHITDNPRILSNGWDFTIHVDEVPLIEEILFTNITKIILPLRSEPTELSRRIGAEVFDESKVESFNNQLLKESYHDIFFLKNVKNITSVKNGKRAFSVSKDDKVIKKDGNYTQFKSRIKIIEHKNASSKKYSESWKKYIAEQISIPYDFKELENTRAQKVEIMLPLSSNNKRIARIFDKEFYGYYTLPVMKSHFNFNYNASMLYVTSGRSEFYTKEGKKTEWNLWQSENIVKLLIYIVNDLVEKKIDPKLIYHIFPIPQSDLQIMDEQIFSLFKTMIEKNDLNFFYTQDKEWRNQSETLQNWDGLVNIFNKKDSFHFINNELVSYKNIFDHYKIKKVSANFLIDYLENKYGTNNTKQQNENPDYLCNVNEYFGKNRMSSEQISKLKRICIILTEENTLKTYDYGLNFATDEKMPAINKGDIVNKNIYNSKYAYKFLKNKLGITILTINSLIEHTFIPRLNNYSDDLKDEVIWYLVRNQNKIKNKKNVINLLKEKLLVIIKNEKNIDDGEIFYNTQELKKVFLDEINYIDIKYEKYGSDNRLNWKSFFSKIGVKETPDTEYIIEAVRKISSNEFTEENVSRIQHLISYLNNNWKKKYSKQIKILEKVRGYKWIPTNKNTLEYPTSVYINKKDVILVGHKHNFITFKLPHNKNLINTIGLTIEPDIDDVIDNLISYNYYSTDKLPMKIYQFLNEYVKSFHTYQIEKLVSNKTIWYKKKLWYPKHAFLENHADKFGPDGWLRVYLVNTQYSKYADLCNILSIKKAPELVDSWITWILDLPTYSTYPKIPMWQIKLLKNALSVIASNIRYLDEEHLLELKTNPIIISTKNEIIPPTEGYLVRKTEDIILNRLVETGYEMNIVFSENAEMDYLLLKLGIRELITAISSIRLESEEKYIDDQLTKQFIEMLPWIDGYEYWRMGTISEYNQVFELVQVFRQKSLLVQYHLEGKQQENLKPIQDVCCVEFDQNLKIYLDENFSFDENEHVQILTNMLVKHLNPEIDKVEWNLIFPQLFKSLKIFGVSPHNRKPLVIPSDTDDEIENWEPEDYETELIVSNARNPEIAQSTSNTVITTDPDVSTLKSKTTPVSTKVQNSSVNKQPIDQEDDIVPWKPEKDPGDALSEIVNYDPAPIDIIAQRGSGSTYNSQTFTPMNIDDSHLSPWDKINIGKWGEECAFNTIINQLSQRYPKHEKIMIDNVCSFRYEERTIAEVIWENHDYETLLPYDIKLIENTTEIYYEVKSTPSESKSWFRISRNQWSFAKQKLDNFHVLRVFNAGKSSVIIQEYQNLYQLWLDGKISADPMRIQI